MAFGISASGSVQNQSGNSTDIFSQLLTSLLQSSGSTTPTENPLFKMFRESLLPALSQEYAKAQQPVYGDAQIAQNAEGANKTFNGAADSATQALARRGALTSGAATSVLSNLGAARAGNIANFNSQIPLLNREYTDQKTQGLLGLAMNFLGQSPIGSQYQSQQQGQQTNNSTDTKNWNQSSSSFGGGFSI